MSWPLANCARLRTLLVVSSLLWLASCAGTSNGGKQGGGPGPGQLAVSPASMDFGNVAVGKKSTLAGTLTAGSADITVSSAAWNGDGFSLSGITFPLTVPAGQSAQFSVTFAPQALGNSSGSVNFDSNATNSPVQEMLSGNGSQSASGHSVALSWSASNSPVTGYNVYRGNASGGPYSKINSTLNLTTSYTDSSVQSGTTYYYVTTAVNSQGAESSYSNQAVASVPSN